MTWISVDDRLPKLETDEDWDFNDSPYVLVLDKWGERFTALYRVWADDDFGPTWIMYGRDGYQADGVTHWMPLPDPPTKD